MVHEYTLGVLAWDVLNGVYRVKTHVLSAAARQAGCKAYLGLVTLWETGSAENCDDGYYHDPYDDWDDDDAEADDDDRDADQYEDRGDGGAYEMGEVFEDSLTAEHLVDCEGLGLPIGQLNVEEAEVLDSSEVLREVEPEEDFEGFTGNAGMTLDRWYRHAAILVWPESKHFEILCDRDSRDIVPVLIQMVARWRKSRSKDAGALKAQCIDLATAILAKWSRCEFAIDDSAEPETGKLLETLAALGEPRLVGDFLGEVLINDVSVDPGTSLTSVCEQFGWDTFQRQLLAVMKSTNNETMERNVRMLEQICLHETATKPGATALGKLLAPELVTAIEVVDRKQSKPDWRSRDVSRAHVLAGLARALLTSDQSALLSRFVAHAFAVPNIYTLADAHVRALVLVASWVRKTFKPPSAAWSQWVAICGEQLRDLTAGVPQEPADYRRAAPITCKCANCADLKRFLTDPGESVFRFRARQDRREHLRQQILKHGCDLNLLTDTKGSPQTLVCTKNLASHKQRLKIYHQNQAHLAAIRSINARRRT